MRYAGTDGKSFISSRRFRSTMLLLKVPAGRTVTRLRNRRHVDAEHPRAFAMREVAAGIAKARSEEHTSELQSHHDLVCRLLLEKKKKKKKQKKKNEKT